MEKMWVVLVALLGVQWCTGLPVNKAQLKEKTLGQAPEAGVPGLDLAEYMKYWEEVSKNDPELSERLKKVKDVDVQKLTEMIAKHPHMQERMVQSRGDVRNQIQEAQRVTVEQMRQLQKLQTMKDNNLLKDGDWITKKEAAREHLPAHFNREDIQTKLHEAKLKLEQLDRQRKDDFKKDEMWQEHRRRQKLAEMNEQQRLKAEEEFKKKHERLRHHDKLPLPGSKEQLEQVWEEEDGLSREQFNPKTFFHMHDTNADKTLDPLELEALFYQELSKVYKDEVNGMEANEDMARMREYAMEQIDQDKDGLVSFEEFMKFTGDANFESKEEWHPIVDEKAPPFSDKEFQDYEEDYDEDYDYQYDSEGNIIGIVPRVHNQEPNEPGQPPQQEGKPPQQEGKPPQQEGQPPQQEGQPPQQEGQPPQQEGQPPENPKGDSAVPAGVQVEDPNAINVKPVEVVQGVPVQGVPVQGVPVQGKPAEPEHEQRMAPPDQL